MPPTPPFSVPLSARPFPPPPLLSLSLSLSKTPLPLSIRLRAAATEERRRTRKRGDLYAGVGVRGGRRVQFLVHVSSRRCPRPDPLVVCVATHAKRIFCRTCSATWIRRQLISTWHNFTRSIRPRGTAEVCDPLVLRVSSSISSSMDTWQTPVSASAKLAMAAVGGPTKRRVAVDQYYG